LLDIPTWVAVQESIQYLFKNKKLNLDLNMDEDKLFDEYNHVAHVIQVKIVEWRNCSKKVTEKWCEVFKILEKILFLSTTYQQLLNTHWLFLGHL